MGVNVTNKIKDPRQCHIKHLFPVLNALLRPEFREQEDHR